MNRADLEQLVANYKRSPEVSLQLSKLTLVMTLGPSGVGKTTLMRASELPMVLGDASRDPRPHEQNGVDYWFRSFDEMLADAKAGTYVQIAAGPEGDLKGTRAGSFPSQGVATFAVVATAIESFRTLGFAQTKTAAIIPPSFDEWMMRLGGHNIDDEKIQRRLREARPSLEFALNDSQTDFILNDSVEAGAARLLQVAAGQTPDNADQARRIAENILDRLAT
jgi:guanylate kinase